MNNIKLVTSLRKLVLKARKTHNLPVNCEGISQEESALHKEDLNRCLWDVSSPADLVENSIASSIYCILNHIEHDDHYAKSYYWVSHVDALLGMYNKEDVNILINAFAEVHYRECSEERVFF